MKRSLDLAALAVAIAIGALLDNRQLNAIIASIVNFSAFINAMTTLEPVFAPLQVSEGALGTTSSRRWCKQGWYAIRIGLCGVCIFLAVVHLMSAKSEPYAILWGLFARPATKLVATGISTGTPKGRWQSLSTRAAHILATFPPFQHVPNPYKAPVALLSAYLALLWASWFGFEQALPWVITLISSNSTANSNVSHVVKRNSSSIASAVWGPAAMNAGVTLGCHVHKAWSDGQQDVAINIQQGAMVQHLATLVEQQKALAEQLAALTAQLPNLIALSVAHQLAAISTSPPAGNRHHQPTTNISGAPNRQAMTSIYSSDASHDTGFIAGPMTELTELDTNGRRKNELPPSE